MSYNTLTDTDLPQADAAQIAQSQAWLDESQSYIDAVYGLRYLGVMIDVLQGDLWPRESSDGAALSDSYGRPISGVPDVIKEVELIGAKLLQDGKILFPVEVATASSASTQNREITEKSVKADEFVTTTKWSPSGTTTSTGVSRQTLSDSGLPIIAAIDGKIAIVLASKPSGSVVKRYRA